MAFLITPANRHLYLSELAAIFRLRHKVLVEDLRWPGLSSRDGMETDEFDNAEAMYIGMTDADGEVVGCMRLNSAERITLTEKAFRHLIQFSPYPKGPDVLDVTRHIVLRRWQTSLRESLESFDLLCALFEFGIAESYSRFTAVMDITLFSVLIQIGVEIDPLGFPQTIDNEECLAVSARVLQASLAALYRASHNSTPRLCMAQSKPAIVPSLNHATAL